MLDDELLPESKTRKRPPFYRGFQIIRSLCLLGGMTGTSMVLFHYQPVYGRYLIFGALITYAITLGAEYLLKQSQGD
jgi:hypothetical protein